MTYFVILEIYDSFFRQFLGANMMRKPDFNLMTDLAIKYRREILKVIHNAGSGHPGGSLSCIDLLIVLYQYKLRYDVKNPSWEDRDRLIVSKGHASPAVYVAMADVGFFPKEELWGFRKIDRILQGHVHTKIPGIELSTGSLGQGLSVANGLGLSAKMKKQDFKVYCILGDGEMQEGSIWEALMTGSHYKIDNVCAILDYNKVQENGRVNDIMNLEPLKERIESFGWNTIDIDGHNFEEITAAFDKFSETTDKPTFIIANTVKGKGVSFMEFNHNWHGKAPNAEMLEKALAELQ